MESFRQANDALGGPRDGMRKLTIDDFELIRYVARGTSGKIFSAQSKTTGAIYALKAIRKDPVINLPTGGCQKYIHDLQQSHPHPYLLPLLACFQNTAYIFVLTPLHPQGDLGDYLRNTGALDVAHVRFYAAEITLALQYLHAHNIICRDLHLDHVLVTLTGNVQVISCACSKHDMPLGSTTKTFCGSSSFIAPELLRDQPYGRAVDWWALGVICHQLILCENPFKADDQEDCFDAILTNELQLPAGLDADASRFIRSLMEKDPDVRLGSSGADAEAVMEHGFFEGMDFLILLEGKMEPPAMPAASMNNPMEREVPDLRLQFEPDIDVSIPSEEHFRDFEYSASMVF